MIAPHFSIGSRFVPVFVEPESIEPVAVEAASVETFPVETVSVKAVAIISVAIITVEIITVAVEQLTCELEIVKALDAALMLEHGGVTSLTNVIIGGGGRPSHKTNLLRKVSEMKEHTYRLNVIANMSGDLQGALRATAGAFKQLKMAATGRANFDTGRLQAQLQELMKMQRALQALKDKNAAANGYKAVQAASGRVTQLRGELRIARSSLEEMKKRLAEARSSGAGRAETSVLRAQIKAKGDELNKYAPQEYEGDLYVGRMKNAWVTYYPYRYGTRAEASIPLKYNTCERMELSYAVQERPEGIAQAFLIGEEFIGDDACALVLGDNIFYGNGLGRMLQARAADAAAGLATIFGYYVDDPERFGVVEFKRDPENRDRNIVLSVEEKPQNPRSSYAIVGLYFYPSGVAELAKQVRPSPRGELEITTLNDMYLRQERLNVSLLGRGYTWMDAGTMESLHDASEFVRMMEIRQSMLVSAPEEIAYRYRWITRDQLRASAEVFGNSPYGQRLRDVAEGKAL